MLGRRDLPPRHFQQAMQSAMSGSAVGSRGAYPGGMGVGVMGAGPPMPRSASHTHSLSDQYGGPSGPGIVVPSNLTSSKTSVNISFTGPMGTVSESFSRALSRDLHGHKSKVLSVDWNTSGKRLASGSGDCTIRIWPLSPTGHLSKEIELKSHTEPVDRVAWHPIDENILASASPDKTVKLWDGRSGRCQHTINTPGDNICMKWHPSGNTIVVGSKNDVVALIDVRTNRVSKTFQLPSTLNEFGFDKTGELLFLTTSAIEVLRYPTLERVDALYAHTGSLYCFTYDHNGRYFAAGSADTLVSIWDAEEFMCLRSIDHLNEPINILSFSHDDLLIAIGSDEKFIDIVDVETSKLVHRIEAREGVHTLAWNPKHYLLAYAIDRSRGLRVFGFDPAHGNSELTTDRR